jgi:thiamine pyrophosphate-dependent acetolactate synthase large subunit-like protein
MGRRRLGVELKASAYVNFGTDLENPDFSTLAVSCGFLGLKVKRAEDLPGAMKQLLAHDGPAPSEPALCKMLFVLVRFRGP